VKIIAGDLATLPCQVFKHRSRRWEGSRPASARPASAALVRMLKFQPNGWQTWTEYMLGMAAQYILRGRAYAEIVPGPGGFLEQLLPRHPDRVETERLPSGRLRYRLTEANGGPRYLTQDEMHTVRDLSFDGGLTVASRVQYGAQAIAIALAAETAAGKFFRSGMTAAKVATYDRREDEGFEDTLHKSITRFATGVDNNFGLMLVPDNVTITNLGVEPDKAQMMLAREWGVREVARHLGPRHGVEARDQGQRRLRVAGAGRDRLRDRHAASDGSDVRAGDAPGPHPGAGHVLRRVQARGAAARRSGCAGQVHQRADQGPRDAPERGAAAPEHEPRRGARPPVGAGLPAWIDGDHRRRPAGTGGSRQCCSAACWRSTTTPFGAYGASAWPSRSSRKNTPTTSRAGRRRSGTSTAITPASWPRRCGSDRDRAWLGGAARDGVRRKGVVVIDGDAGAQWEREEADELAMLAAEGERLAA
jgi:HK97 family phage portal protein